MYLLKLGIKIAVPITAFYVYRNVPRNMWRNAFKLVKNIFLNTFR